MCTTCFKLDIECVGFSRNLKLEENFTNNYEWHVNPDYQHAIIIYAMSLYKGQGQMSIYYNQSNT